MFQLFSNKPWCTCGIHFIGAVSPSCWANLQHTHSANLRTTRKGHQIWLKPSEMQFFLVETGEYFLGKTTHVKLSCCSNSKHSRGIQEKGWGTGICIFRIVMLHKSEVYSGFGLYCFQEEAVSSWGLMQCAATYVAEECIPESDFIFKCHRGRGNNSKPMSPNSPIDIIIKNKTPIWKSRGKYYGWPRISRLLAKGSPT